MTTRRLALILGDQLSFDLPSLQALDPQQDAVLLAEVAAETDYVPHHPQKIALIFSAMRHFAEALRERGWRVQYVALDDPDNSGSLPGELQRWAAHLQATEVHVTECGEWRLEDQLKRSGVPITWHADSRFICGRDEFVQWAEGRKQLRMEFFYREMRRKTGLLLNGDGTPVGGASALGGWTLNVADPEDVDEARLLFTPDPLSADMLERYRSAMRAVYKLPDDPTSPSNRLTVFVVRDANQVRKLLGEGSRDPQLAPAMVLGQGHIGASRTASRRDVPPDRILLEC